MNRKLKVKTEAAAIQHPIIEIEEIKEMLEDEFSPANKIKTSKFDQGSISLFTLQNEVVESEPSVTPQVNGGLKRRKAVPKRCSMTDIDLLNRSSMMNEIKESTRKLVAFTIKNLNKNKKVEHFINKDFNITPKDLEFEHYYEILENLGEGCSSVVKLCRNKANNMLYAVKIFRAFDDEYINFAKNEFSNMKAINSDYVAKVYEMFYDQERCKIYTVMEYCKGMTVSRMIKEVGVLPGNHINK